MSTTLIQTSTSLAPGTPVEVQNRFTGTWCRGFEVEAIVRTESLAPQVRIRRQSDRSVLPQLFEEAAVRPAA